MSRDIKSFYDVQETYSIMKHNELINQIDLVHTERQPTFFSKEGSLLLDSVLDSTRGV